MSADKAPWTGSYNIAFETVWGDGNGETETQTGFAAGETYTLSFPHTYTAADTYQVQLTATLSSDDSTSPFDGMVAYYSEYLMVGSNECESDVAASPSSSTTPEAPVAAPTASDGDREGGGGGGVDGIDGNQSGVLTGRNYRFGTIAAVLSTITLMMMTTPLALY